MIFNEKAKKHIEEIKRQTFIGDAHLDLAYDLVRKRSWGRRRVLEEDYYSDMVKGGINFVISSIFIDGKFIPEMALRRGLMQFEALLSDIEESEHFKFCTSKKEIEKNFEDGFISIMISFEGVEPIYDDLNMLKIFKRLGLKGVGLSWSRRNYAADGSKFVDAVEGKVGGLTEFGIDLLDKMYSEKLFLDLSHINDEGFQDAVTNFKGKIMVSHTNSRTLNNTKRNISDDQIRIIAKRKGFIGVNAMNFTVSDGKTPEDIRGYCDHVNRIIEIAGEDYVGLGFDFNDIILDHIPSGELVNLPRKPFDCIKGYKEIDLLILEFMRRNYSESRIKKILGENLLNFLGEV